MQASMGKIKDSTFPLMDQRQRMSKTFSFVLVF